MSNELCPQTLQQAIEYFADEDTCHAFMVSMRWVNGVTCPRCGCEDSGRIKFIETRRIWRCNACKKQFSVKVGTIFEDSPLPMKSWLGAVWMIVNAKNGISSCEIARSLGVTQKTAWFMAHRIRLALQAGSFEKLKGQVEADETFIGGKASNMHKAEREKKIKGRGSVGKAVVLGLLERQDGKPSKVRAKVVKDTTSETLQSEVRENVEAGSELFTDAWKSYRGLGVEYQHRFVDHAVAYVDGQVSTNGLENFWCLLKRTVKGTYVAVDAQHLFRYLDEQAYRYNNRKSNDAERFLKAVKWVSGKRLTRAELTSK